MVDHAPRQAPRLRLELVTPDASPVEAAAIVAALERFVEEASLRQAPRDDGLDGWRRAAMLEAISCQPDDDLSDLWIKT